MPLAPLATSPPEVCPNAISTPHNFLLSGNLPHSFFRSRFGPILGLVVGQRLYCRNQGTQYFLSPHPEDTIVYKTESPLASLERYGWFVVAESRSLEMLAVPYRVQSFFERPDAVKFGWLFDEGAILPPTSEARIAARQNTIAKESAWAVLMSRLGQLVAVPEMDLDSAQKEELLEIRRKIAQVAEEGPDALLPKIVTT
jgi:hypothetical protein